ncbi:HARB1-like protein, partial [Mya arenaria]
FSNDNIDRLVDLLTDRLRRPTQRNHSLTVRQQVMIALRFYASGAFLQVIGDTFGVDIATVSRTVTDVTNALFDLRDRAIKFPTEAADLQAAKSAFYARTNFPSVVGCVDGTHIHIQSPGGLDESAYAKSQASVHVGQGHVMMPMCEGPPVYANTWKRITKIRMKPAKVCKVIVACAVLYNLSILWKEPFEEGGEEDDQPPTQPYNGPMDGKGIRDHISQTYFSS